MSPNNNADSIRIAEEAKDIETIVKEAKKNTCVYLLVVLQSIINEQIAARQLKRDVGDYIYQAVKDQAIRRDWIE